MCEIWIYPKICDFRVIKRSYPPIFIIQNFNIPLCQIVNNVNILLAYESVYISEISVIKFEEFQIKNDTYL